MQTLTPMNEIAPCLAMLRLASPALPIGAYAYSQGLEYACHLNWVRDEETLRAWLNGLLVHTQGHTDAPLFIRLHAAWTAGDTARATYWGQYLLACRETRELREEDVHLGQALARLLVAWGVHDAVSLQTAPWAIYAVTFTRAAVHGQIPCAQALSAYLWAWAENQVIAAQKLLPLGQAAAQRVLSAIATTLPSVVNTAFTLTDADIGASAPGLTMASACHEEQYSRLFRS